MLKLWSPEFRGKVEADDSVEPGAYDYVWISNPLARPDPCATLRMPE